MTIGTGFMIVATTMPMNMMLEKISLGMIETCPTGRPQRNTSRHRLGFRAHFQ